MTLEVLEARARVESGVDSAPVYALGQTPLRDGLEYLALVSNVSASRLLYNEKRSDWRQSRHGLHSWKAISLWV
jgi:hypothetical protein